MTDLIPPPELIVKWASSMCGYYEAARWGADQELEACCEWVANQFHGYSTWAGELRAARRPTPTLKEQALDLLSRHNDGWAPSPKQWDTIRAALEQLPDAPTATPDPAPTADGPVATDDKRIVIARALVAEADSNDDDTHCVWITSHELRQAAKILREDIGRALEQLPDN